MPLKNERIACPAVAVLIGDHTYYDIVPITQLVMDRVNYHIKNNPHTRIKYEEYFITTHGRAVPAHEAFEIAFKAHQIVSDKVKPPLSSLDIWPRR